MSYSKNEETLQNLAKKYESIRKNWTSQVQEISQSFKKISNLPETQAKLYHDIQELNEVSTKLRMELSKIHKQMRTTRKDRWIQIKTKVDFQLKTSDDFNVWLEEELTDLIELETLTKNQLMFYEETTKNINSMIYGIKYRIALEQEILS